MFQDRRELDGGEEQAVQAGKPAQEKAQCKSMIKAATDGHSTCIISFKAQTGSY